MAGKLIIVSGPSGVGKGTVMKRVFAKNSNIRFSVSATTRSIRPGEVDGESYYFVSKAEFEELIKQNALLEYTQYVGNFYGTPEEPLNRDLQKGYDVYLDIEVQGALHIKERRPDAILIFMVAPSFAELKRRLYERGDTAPELCEKRLAQAKREYAQASGYDYVVVNNDPDAAAEEILSIIKAEKCRYAERINLFEEEF